MSFVEVYDIITRGGATMILVAAGYALYSRKLAWGWQVDDERARTEVEREEKIYWRSLALQGTGLLSSIAEKSAGKGAQL